jgi:hypothetical protein
MAKVGSLPDLNRRKSKRTEVDEIAFIYLSGSSTRCRVVNVSSDGAAIDVPDVRYIPDRFGLMIQSDRLIRTCRVAWIRENRIGVEFEPSLEEAGPVTHRDRQFLQHLRSGQWRPATGLPGGEKLISKLLTNGWIESSGNSHDRAYRITPKGLAAKLVPVKL